MKLGLSRILFLELVRSLEIIVAGTSRPGFFQDPVVFVDRLGLAIEEILKTLSDAVIARSR